MGESDSTIVRDEEGVEETETKEEKEKREKEEREKREKEATYLLSTSINTLGAYYLDLW